MACIPTFNFDINLDFPIFDDILGFAAKVSGILNAVDSFLGFIGNFDLGGFIGDILSSVGKLVTGIVDQLISLIPRAFKLLQLALPDLSTLMVKLNLFNNPLVGKKDLGNLLGGTVSDILDFLQFGSIFDLFGALGIDGAAAQFIDIPRLLNGEINGLFCLGKYSNIPLIDGKAGAISFSCGSQELRTACMSRDKRPTGFGVAAGDFIDELSRKAREEVNEFTFKRERELFANSMLCKMSSLQDEFNVLTFTNKQIQINDLLFLDELNEGIEGVSGQFGKLAANLERYIYPPQNALLANADTNP